MKYKRLSKEQLEELHQEFITFLSTQSITADEWTEIKKSKPEIAEEEIDVFSDLVWERVLNNAEYLEHFSPSQMHLFKLEEKEMRLIAIKVDYPDVDITKKEGYDWLRNNLMDEKVLFYNSTKSYGDDPSIDKFDLILKGARITKGELFNYFEDLIELG